MSKALLIAEKPDLMRKIKEVYDKHHAELPYTIDFETQRGHLLTLKKPDELDESLKTWSWETIPINPEDYGGFQYKVIEEKKTGNFMTAKERYTQIKSKVLSGNYDFVINAGDPDQEGELLVRIVLSKIGNKLPIKRFWTNDLTEKNILAALKDLRDDENDRQLVNLLDAAYCRQHSDWRVGMSVSRAASMKMNSRVACGRVKTPILAIVCKREEEIENFTSKTVYGVKAVYEEGFGGVLFVDTKNDDAIVNDDDDDEENKEEGKGVVWFDTIEEANEIIATLGKDAVILEYKEKTEKKFAPKLFKLATAQKAAGALGYSAAETQKIIQSLYEKKVMSYPRTGCVYIHSDEDFTAMLESASKVPCLKEVIAGITEEDKARVRASKTWVNDKEAKEEGHTALVPTTQSPDWNALSKEEQDIYTMIAKQFVAAFLPPLVQKKTLLIASIDGKLFRSTGTSLVDEGYTRIFDKTFQETAIPACKKGIHLTVKEYQKPEKTSKCPKRYTTPELIAVCENPAKFLDDQSLKKLGKRLKIGTPATRSGIIEELVRDKYLCYQKDGRRSVVAPTQTGRTIIRNIGTCSICKVDLTGEWEEKLEDVRKGNLTKENFEKEMRQNVKNLVDDIHKMEMSTIDGKKKKDIQELGVCPKCGKKVLRGERKFFCTGYKEGCKVGGFIEKNGAVLTNEEFMDLLVNGSSVKKQMTSGEETWEQEIKVDKNGALQYVSEGTATAFVCPVCKKPIKETPMAYTCSGVDNKTCQFNIQKTLGGKRIEKEQFEKLFTKGETDCICGFYSEKKQKHYDAVLFYDQAEKKISLRADRKEEATNFTCPICKTHLVGKGMKLICKECQFEMYRVSHNEELKNDDVWKLLQKVESGDIKKSPDAYITKGEVPTDWECPFCGGKVVRNGMHFYCKGIRNNPCNLSFYRSISGHIIDDKEIDMLMEEGRTPVFSDFVSKKGTNYNAFICWDYDKHTLAIKFDDAPSKAVKYKCPICGEKLMQNGRKISCACGFSMWTMVSDKPIPQEDLELLFTKGETRFLPMISKSGKGYKAKIAIDKANKKTKLVFK